MFSSSTASTLRLTRCVRLWGSAHDEVFRSTSAHKTLFSISGHCATVQPRRPFGEMAIKTLNFDAFKEKLEKPGIIVLDVREKGELVSDGKIAGSKNIPVGEISEAVKLGNEEFQEKYGFSKPKTNDDIIIHCKAGVRAENAAKALLGSGYEHVEVYPGILDWVKNGGQVEK